MSTSSASSEKEASPSVSVSASGGASVSASGGASGGAGGEKEPTYYLYHCSIDINKVPMEDYSRSYTNEMVVQAESEAKALEIAGKSNKGHDTREIWKDVSKIFIHRIGISDSNGNFGVVVSSQEDTG